MLHRDQTPAILLLHDGELADLAPLIASLGGVERCGNPTDADRSATWDVAIATAGRMLALHEHLPETSAVRIAVMDGDSKTLRKMLYRVDTDLLIRQPVHPAALRLLILHALYRGPEKRRSSRVSIGAAVRFRSGLRRRDAILAELSQRGCRLIAQRGSHRAAPERLVTIALPAELTGDGRPLALRGHVVRIMRADADSDAVAVLFELLTQPERQRLESILAAHRQGPAAHERATPRARAPLPTAARSQPARAAETARAPDPEQRAAPAAEPAQAAGPASAPGPTVPPQPSPSESPERRNRQRHSLSRRIVALGDEAARVLIGRDLSVGGMRIDAAPGFSLGDRLQVAVHVRADGQPLVVSAEVARDDGPDGMALRFVDLGAAARECLEAMVGALPAILEPDGSRDGARLVVSEVVGRSPS
ncbi:MAG TPA: PilZ domain-containing protein [Myxococcota bacterium]|nr:PilZ domain-containing protein [Myxococcota bacterium]